MNTSAANGMSLSLRDWLTESDEWLSPQAAVLSPQATCRIAAAIVAADGGYARTIAAGRAAAAILREGVVAGELALGMKELQWLDRIDAALDDLPPGEGALLEEMSVQHGALFNRASYSL